ncbi:hypothetical protein [Ruminococcus flavefaciens]|jgi:hypothetical protein|uniref:hypothetical protein n=1 Tax=Ruminococcus flavefaciens TaxID=1265 RepID=UPI001564586B|nr:hypothetical protein [Ruminococcus flavefaciens]
MTDRQLKKLKRSELIELLYYARKEIDRLSQENEQLRSRLDKLVGEALHETSDADGTES